MGSSSKAMLEAFKGKEEKTTLVSGLFLFDLESALATKKAITRDGRQVTELHENTSLQLICSEFKLAGKINGEWHSWKLSGKSNQDNTDSPLDLFVTRQEIPKPKFNIGDLVWCPKANCRIGQITQYAWRERFKNYNYEIKYHDNTFAYAIEKDIQFADRRGSDKKYTIHKEDMNFITLGFEKVSPSPDDKFKINDEVIVIEKAHIFHLISNLVITEVYQGKGGKFYKLTSEDAGSTIAHENVIAHKPKI